ncbi:MAG: SRPBCC family protein [Bdellovibrionia bacterium]
MGRFQNQILINAPIEKVWSVLADVEAVKNYNPLVASAKRTSDNKEGLGCSRYCEFKPSGFAKERVIAFNPKSQISFEVVESSWPVKSMKWSTHLKAQGSSTLMTQDLEYETKFGILGKVMDAVIMKRKLQQSVGDIFSSLKKYVETT